MSSNKFKKALQYIQEMYQVVELIKSNPYVSDDDKFHIKDEYKRTIIV